jgi:predicted kinase
MAIAAELHVLDAPIDVLWHRLEQRNAMTAPRWSRFTPEQFTPEQFTPEQFTPEQFTPEPVHAAGALRVGATLRVP